MSADQPSTGRVRTVGNTPTARTRAVVGDQQANPEVTDKWRRSAPAEPAEQEPADPGQES